MLKPSAVGLVAGAIAVATDVLYLSLIFSQGEGDMEVVAFFAVLIGGAGLAAFAGSLERRPLVRAGLLWPAAVVLIAVGMLAIFSIGLPLLGAGALAAVAAVRAQGGARTG